jgi:type I restriction enzyme M protein
VTDDQKKKLEQKLWDIANALRGKMNADEFRDYILGFIFYKYLSERMHIYANEVLEEDGIDFLAISESTTEGQEYLHAVRDASIEALGYFLKPSELFSAVAKRGAQPGQFILSDLTAILNNIQRSTMGTESEEEFDHLFEDLDLTSTKLGRTEEAKNALIAKVLAHLDEIDFRLKEADSDVLGDAYEYLIGKFASGAGKKAGEFYTPQEVSTVLAKIVTTGKTRLKSIYDPTCGSGSLLLRVAREVEEIGDFYGQEMNRTTYNLARMNMILHGVHYRNFNLRQEDTLTAPQHEGMLFEAVVANPPFSARWSANKVFETDDRFAQYGRLAPGSKADFAFVQHMLHHLDENGTMAVILPHGVLFRGAAEGAIREYLVKDRNWLDAVIGLPANIFYGTSIPTCILVFKKCRETEDVLFVDASSYFEKSTNQNYLRTEDIDRIVTTYRSRAELARFSHRASLAEIAENEFNLNIPRYVDTFEEEAPIDLTAVVADLKVLERAMGPLNEAIRGYCTQLGLESPV